MRNAKWELNLSPPLNPLPVKLICIDRSLSRGGENNCGIMSLSTYRALLRSYFTLLIYLINI
jgi:hypothetical protein